MGTSILEGTCRSSYKPDILILLQDAVGNIAVSSMKPIEVADRAANLVLTGRPSIFAVAGEDLSENRVYANYFVVGIPAHEILLPWLMPRCGSDGTAVACRLCFRRPAS
jgi:hypothetical protein